MSDVACTCVLVLVLYVYCSHVQGCHAINVLLGGGVRVRVRVRVQRKFKGKIKGTTKPWSRLRVYGDHPPYISLPRMSP